MNHETYIRVWQSLDLDDIKEHLLIAGDPTGDCANCKAIGIRISEAQVCPECGTPFRYIATRLANNPRQARMLKQKRGDLIAIELSDFKDATARKNARNFMG